MLRFHRPVTVVLCLAALALGAGGAGCKRQPSDPKPAAETAEPVRVTAAPAQKAPMPVLTLFTGTLRADREARLAASTAGRVLKLNVARGDQVKAGQVLAELDSSTAALSAAEAHKAAQNAKVQREMMKKDCERAQQLFEAGAISKSQLDAQKAQCDSADLGVDAAGLRASMGAVAIRDASIKAPFAGVIETRDTEVGEYLMPGSRVATLVAVEKLRLDIVIPEAQLSHVKVGNAVTFRVAAFRDRTFTARIELVGATVRQGTRDVLVEASVDNADGALKPGMFTTVEVVTSESEVPIIPKSAIVKRGDASHVFVVVDGRAHERIVKLGTEKGTDVAVIRGVSTGEKVVSQPPESLRNGAAVEGG